MASDSRFRLSANDFPTPSTPIPTYPHFLSSNPALVSYNFTTTRYALNTPRAQTATPCPQVRQKRKKENQPLSIVLPTLNSEEPVRKKTETVIWASTKHHRQTCSRLQCGIAYFFKLVVVWFYRSRLIFSQNVSNKSAACFGIVGGLGILRGFR